MGSHCRLRTVLAHRWHTSWIMISQNSLSSQFASLLFHSCESCGCSRQTEWKNRMLYQFQWLKYIYLLTVWIPSECSHEFLCCVGGGHPAQVRSQGKRMCIFCLSVAMGGSCPLRCRFIASWFMGLCVSASVIRPQGDGVNKKSENERKHSVRLTKGYKLENERFVLNHQRIY